LKSAKLKPITVEVSMLTRLCRDSSKVV